jgi:hypothetical protein
VSQDLKPFLVSVDNVTAIVLDLLLERFNPLLFFFVCCFLFEDLACLLEMYSILKVILLLP